MATIWFWLSSAAIIALVAAKSLDKEKIASAFGEFIAPKATNAVLFKFIEEGLTGYSPFGARFPVIPWSQITAYTLPENSKNFYLRVEQFDKLVDAADAGTNSGIRKKLSDRGNQWRAFMGGHICLSTQLAVEDLNAVHEALKEHLNPEQMAKSGYFVKGKVTPIDGPIPSAKQ